jgi:hypothetical protein
MPDGWRGTWASEYLGGALDPLKTDRQAAASRNIQIAVTAMDCTGLCVLTGFAPTAAKGGAGLLDGHEPQVR